MAKRVAGWWLWCGFLTGLVITATVCRAATDKSSAASGRLVAMAAAEFSNLTEAERALLVFVDLKNRAQGDFAHGGTSANPSDPTNDPAHADKWGHEREIRADLIRWLCVDPDASRMVDPAGIRIDNRVGLVD